MEGRCENCKHEHECNKTIGIMWGFCNTDFEPVSNDQPVEQLYRVVMYRWDGKRKIYATGVTEEEATRICEEWCYDDGYFMDIGIEKCEEEQK